MTVLGVFFIPATLFCFLWQPFYLLPLLVLSSVFEAGAVFNSQLGDFNFGITPFYLVEVCIALRLAMLILGRQKWFPSKQDCVRTVALLLCAFWLWCCISAFVMPRVFAGMSVIAARSDLDEFAPLQWTLSNLAQAGYLTLNLATLIYATYMVRARAQAEQLMKALYWAIFIVVIVGFSQAFAEQVGWDFPYEIFNSNVAYALGTTQDVGTLHRINSTFMEPSMAGSYLAAVTCGLAAGLFTKMEIQRLVATILVLATLLLTTSSTGLLALAVGGCLLVFYFHPFRSRSGHKSSLKTWVLLAVFAGVGYWLLSDTDLWEALVFGTLEKTETYSFWSRLAKEGQALSLFVNTYGLGVGLGSNRSSGLLTTMLSTVGIVGTSLLGFVFYRVGKLFSGSSKPRSLQIAFWALVVMVVSEIVGVPDLNRPTMWCFLLIVLTYLNSKTGLSPALAPARARRVVPSPSPLEGAWEPAARG